MLSIATCSSNVEIRFANFLAFARPQECEESIWNHSIIGIKYKHSIFWLHSAQYTKLGCYVLAITFLVYNLRLHLRLQRDCNETCTIKGVKIPQGMPIMVPCYAVHHDPEIYPDPEKFDPERWDRLFVCWHWWIELLLPNFIRIWLLISECSLD